MSQYEVFRIHGEYWYVWDNSAAAERARFYGPEAEQDARWYADLKNGGLPAVIANVPLLAKAFKEGLRR